MISISSKAKQALLSSNQPSSQREIMKVLSSPLAKQIKQYSLIYSRVLPPIFGVLVLMIFTLKPNLMDSPSSETSHHQSATVNAKMAFQFHQPHLPNNLEN
jgi:hypothetical protein